MTLVYKVTDLPAWPGKKTADRRKDAPRYYLVGDSSIIEQDYFSLREAIDAARAAK